MLGRRALVDVTTVAIEIVTLGLRVRIKRLPEPVLIAAVGLLGAVLQQAS